MIQNTAKLSAQLTFWLLSVIYFVAFALPSYAMPPIFRQSLENRTMAAELDEVLYGYQCTAAAFMSMFDSPISFLGSLANIAVFAMFILQFLQLPGKLNILKSTLVVVCIVSTLIWAVALRIGLQSGYYIWTFACIGMSFAFTAQKPFSDDFDDILLDEHTIERNMEE